MGAGETEEKTWDERLEEFSCRAFGVETEQQFARILILPQALRFELRKHRGKVKHAKARLDEARKILLQEKRNGILEERRLVFLAEWVEEHAKHLAWCERRLKLLLDRSQGVVTERPAKYELRHQG